jgi:hypothetical protein
VSEPLAVIEPGVYSDITAEDYHRHASLSSSGARRILPPSCPAKFRHGKTEHSTAFDIGHAAHKLVLGEGPELVEVKAKDWRTKAAQQAQADAYDAGHVPLLTHQLKAVHDMAGALLSHELASTLLAPGSGVAEQSLFWRDPITDVMLRCRPDWLSPQWAVDYKTTESAEPQAIRRSVHKFGYYQQAPFYRDGITALGLGDDLPFLFIFQEKTAPYLITVVQLDDVSMDIGARLNRQAIDLYADCLAANRWPSYDGADDVVSVALPPYALRDLEYA